MLPLAGKALGVIIAITGSAYLRIGGNRGAPPATTATSSPKRRQNPRQ